MSARLDEIAEGVAAVLSRSAEPEPLRMEMRGHSPVEVTFFVRALAAACSRADAPLALVRVDRKLGERLVQSITQDEPLALSETEIELADDLGATVEIYRRAPA